MTQKNSKPIVVNSISDLFRLMRLVKPAHPLISLLKLEPETFSRFNGSIRLIFSFYCISIRSKFKYGKSNGDHGESFFAVMSPGQLISADNDLNTESTGWWLVFHPDFIQNYALGKSIKKLGSLSNAMNEAFHLSEEEAKILDTIMKNINEEYHHPIDQFSQNVIVSYFDLLFNYSNRFYSRKFSTPKVADNDLLVRLDRSLSDYFNSDKIQKFGLPSVQYISENMHFSANYLSDMLRSLTGQNTQQHIHNKLIEKSKEMLLTTNLSVREIAYQMGFEHSQSFSKLFKGKTKVSPIKFRQSFIKAYKI